VLIDVIMLWVVALAALGTKFVDLNQTCASNVGGCENETSCECACILGGIERNFNLNHTAYQYYHENARQYGCLRGGEYNQV
jgi:hypothetical protein